MKKFLITMLTLMAIGLSACAGALPTAAPDATAPADATSEATSTPDAEAEYYLELPDLLLYHVVDGVLLSSELAALDSVITLQGSVIQISGSESALVLNGNVNVVEADLIACNGVIHIIDDVLTLPEPVSEDVSAAATQTANMNDSNEAPEDCESMEDLLRSDERFSNIVAALEWAELMDLLDGDGSYTLFVPEEFLFVPPTSDDGEKITICHATGSEKNPYVMITISVNGLNGHEDHQNGEDIIPAPAGGCPGGN
ncbi:MAG: fasciclin domain-containing protein [Anaerolineae bacterium]|nr:MAG: fasciclin domain-containing protein [Anaerolineae bacterium]